MQQQAASAVWLAQDIIAITRINRGHTTTKQNLIKIIKHGPSGNKLALKVDHLAELAGAVLESRHTHRQMSLTSCE